MKQMLKMYPKIEQYFDNVIVDNSQVFISCENGLKLYFEFKNPIFNTTYNVAEAVATLMRMSEFENENQIWNTELNLIDQEIESTLGAIQWLTGGPKTWEKMNLDWFQHCNTIDDQYSQKIKDIVKASNTLGDIREKFYRHLNLDKMYNSMLELT